MIKNISKKKFGLMALAALVLECSITMVPLRAGAALFSAETREVWTPSEAEIILETAAGVPLKDVINNSVRSGQRIHEVVAACIKVGIDPSLCIPPLPKDTQLKPLSRQS